MILQVKMTPMQMLQAMVMMIYPTGIEVMTPMRMQSLQLKRSYSSLNVMRKATIYLIKGTWIG